MSADLSSIIRSAPVSRHNYAEHANYDAVLAVGESYFRRLTEGGRLRKHEERVDAHIQVLRCVDCGRESAAWRRV